MFKKYKRKIIRDVLDNLIELKNHYDIVNATKKEVEDLDDYDLGIGIGIRQSISRVYEMYYDNVMTKERAERTFGIKIVEDEIYSEDVQ